MFSFIARYTPLRFLPRPLALGRVPAGFPSPAEDYIDRQLDLNEFIEHPAATFFFRLEGDSMEPVMRDGDLLVVDRAKTARDGHVVVAVHNGDLTVKRLRRSGNDAWLEPENPNYPRMPCSDDTEIWGVVLINLHWPSLS
ncbi:MAG TPA: peptidase S24 [Thalassospira lucentensis]|uniref:Peptidase S24 n=1 Tax=Thalassospira lucentensis TaxID=168935 RepID=A0A3D5N876_9PROT|nr:S24 family peptidase [Thalassospira lucentensis]HCW67606.1 peptidase S24 [Thalassospira lucentensis]|tara:strand:+ start:592 stop:1011 length:420 start_codon:yes stop_codon:yes gene_type:complete